MKSIRLLAASLLVALSMGISSCSEELDSQPMESYPAGGEPLDAACKEYGISDYEDIELLNYYKSGLEQANFSGLRDNKLWLASFNVEDKSPIINWTDELPFNRNRRIYKGYGEYEDVTIQQIALLKTIPFNQNFVASLSYSFGKDYHYNALLFKQSSQTKEVQVKRSEIFAGFQYSIINNDCCYSLSGDTLYIAEKGFGYSNVGTLYTSELISHEEAIYTHRDNKGFFVGKRSFKLGEDLWHIQVPQLNDEPADAKIEVSVEDKSTPIWKFNVNIIHYDGTKKNVTFEIDTDNGTIKGQDDYASLIIGKWKMTSGDANATHVTYKSDGTFECTSTENPLYNEVGKYKIDGNKLYEMYSDEEEWIINDILLLNSMTLSVQELEADGVTPSGKKFAYQRVK
ncbi:hypothetical protein [Bacteroides uniformis]|uniref:hypothetical protein n=1 Tax=Bacteroides uniformis TaxID=820 RepID=UPI00321B050C